MVAVSLQLRLPASFAASCRPYLVISHATALACSRMSMPLPRSPYALLGLSLAVMLLAASKAKADEPTAVRSGTSDSTEAKTATPPPAGHSVHGEAFNEGPRQGAHLMGNTGRVKFPITTSNPQAQQFFEQGIGQLHGFWYWEAERSFRQVAALDPNCAMAYWGMAMANVNNADRATRFIREAVKRKTGLSRREEMYVDALAAYYGDLDKAKQDEGRAKEQPDRGQAKDDSNNARAAAYPDEQASGDGKPAQKKAQIARSNRRGRSGDTADAKKSAERKRKRDYIRKLEAIIHEFPDDVEAKAFLAYQIWSWKGTLEIHSHQAVDSLLELIFQAEPMHPAHHYRIHLWDEEKASRALASAARCGQSAPAIAHMWHMPGHTYSKLHRYEDAVYQQEASARVDHAYMMRDRVLPYQIHNYAHNNEWCARNLAYVGRVRDAIALAKNMIELPRHPRLNTASDRGSAGGFGRERLIETLLTYELWDDYIRLANSPYLESRDTPEEQIKQLRNLAVAHFSSGNRGQGADQLQSLEQKLAAWKSEQEEAGNKAAEKAPEQSDDKIKKARDDARKPFEERIQQAEKAIAHVQGAQAATAGDHARAVELFEKAGDVRKPHLARAHLLAGNKEKAEQLASQVVDDAKNQVYPLATYVEVLYGVGKFDEAKRAFDQLREISGSIDLKAPIFGRIGAMAVALGYPAEWRVSRLAGSDVGNRLELETLGPFRWQPSPAPEWQLPDAEGRPVSLRSNYTGKPVVVIFYLGYGCLHCVEQLQAFAPLTKSFNEAGIELVAISTDPVADLKRSIDAVRAEGGFPFPLLSAADLNAFRAYRCFDDFEGRPLHGTFFIDGHGLVRWQDIGAQPFKDARFLLDEAKRLLALPRAM